MVDKISIGRKVWVITESTSKDSVDKSKVYTVIAIKPYNEVKDITNHAVIRDEDGNEIEVRDYLALIIPDTNLSEDEQVSKFLRDNRCLHDGVYTNSEGVTSVEINWGDWKHEHLWCDELMRYLEYIHVSDVETAENGSDCYSAIHYYLKNK